jgi:hypothetical protein
MSLVAILSAQVWHREFVEERPSWPEEADAPRVMIGAEVA